MTSEFAFVMRAVGCSARDVAVMDTEAHNLDWGKVFQLAKEQAVPLILTYILRHQKDIPCPEEMRREHSAQMFATLLETNEKKENVLSLLHEMEETVSGSFKYLLRLSSAGGLGETICTEQANVDWHSLLQLAFEQSVFPVTAYAILQNPEIMPDTEVQQDLLEQIRYSSYRNILRRQRIMGLLREMEEHGIQAVLLKGYEVAQCYQMPECRESADTDVLVPKECERAAHDFLKEKGFTLEPRGKAGHHSVGQHKKYGMVELHVNLYDEIIQEVWFQGMRDEDFILESLRREKTKEESYLTLGCTDHLLFLMLHMVKHFIISGTSLGMMLDTALFFRKHRAKIDTDRIWKILAH